MPEKRGRWRNHALCLAGGALSCGTTHAMLTPLDVAKVRIQAFPGMYSGAAAALRSIGRTEGVKGLTLGWAPSAIGYSAQGAFKFGFYEIFKDLTTVVVGEENARKYRGSMWCMSAAGAEVFADVALCPFEMAKVRMQTTADFPRKLLPAMRRMQLQRQTTNFPFGALWPLWSRQIPYTVAKFYFFERVVQLVYDRLLTRPKDEYSSTQQLAVTFGSGYASGVLCAVVSHPADVVVSQIGRGDTAGKTFVTVARQLGVRKLLTQGLGTRILMVGTLTGLQWWIYDTFKTAVGLGTTGGT